MQTKHKVKATGAAKKNAAQIRLAKKATVKKEAAEPRPVATPKKTKTDRYDAARVTGQNPYRPTSKRAYLFDLLAKAKSPGLSIPTIEKQMTAAKKHTPVSTIRSWLSSMRRHSLGLVEENGHYRLEAKKGGKQ